MRWGEVNKLARIKVDLSKKNMILTGEQSLEKSLGKLNNELETIRNSLRYKIVAMDQIGERMKTVSAQIARESSSICGLYIGFTQIMSEYERVEKNNHNDLSVKWSGLEKAAGTSGPKQTSESDEDPLWKRFLNEFLEAFGLSELLAGSNYIGKIYDMFTGFRNSDSIKDRVDLFGNVLSFLREAATTFSHYKKIGNAVGIKKAMTWWAKNVTGWKPLGRASSAKNVTTRFWHNLTNKTSPYNAEIKNRLGNFSGKNGIGKAVASWVGVAVSAVFNWVDNREEQANSGGTMSDGRVFAETVVETTIDTAASIGVNALVGAAITAVAGTAAAPELLVVAATGLVVAGINAGVKAITGKSATEWLSDVILDAGEAIGKTVGKAAKKVKDTVCGWFKRFSSA